jgi:hypothetical protein
LESPPWRLLGRWALAWLGVKEAVKSTVTRAISWGQEQVEQVFPSELPQANKNAAFSIFVAKLGGDEDGLQTKHVLESLRHSFDATDAQHGIEVREIRRVLREGTSGDVFRDHQKARETGKEWLKQSGAHVLIWGYVAERNKALRIFFLPGEGTGIFPLPGKGTLEKRPSETYTFTDRFQLSEDFGEDLGLVIAVRAVALATPLLLAPYGQNPHYQRLKALAKQRLINQTKAGCQLKSALGEMVFCSFPLDDSNMVEAIGIFQEVVGDSRCAADSDLIAQVQAQLGFAFLTLGKHESGTARLEQAVARIALLLTFSRRREQAI